MDGAGGVDYGSLKPREARQLFRQGLVRQTSGMCYGYLQVSVKMIPQRYAFDFLLYCQRNPAPLPALEVLEPGVYSPKVLASGADVRTDCPRYRVWRNGEVAASPNDLLEFWRDAVDTTLADTYPSRPIRWIVAYPPGGTTDIIVRLVAPELGKRLGQYVVIENRGGGAGIIGTNAAAKAAPDGYTLSVGYITTHAIHPSLMKSLPYDPLNDFIPISLMGKAPVILVVHPSVPAKTVKELIAYAKSKPGQLNNSSPGNGSPPHLAGELFKKLAGVEIVHVPYKGSPEALQDTISGTIHLTFGGVATVLPHIRAGKLRPLGISSLETSPLAPDILPIAQLGFPGFESTSWWGMSVRSGVPKDIVTRLNTEVVKVIQLPEIRERFNSLGVIPTWSTPAEFDAYIRAETRKWGSLIREYGIKID